VCANQEAGPFSGPKRGYNRGNFGYLKNFPLTNNSLNALIFGMKQPWDKEIQVCANKVPGVINGPTPERGKKGEFVLKYSDELIDQMQRYLAWIIPMACRYIIRLCSTYDPDLMSHRFTDFM